MAKISALPKVTINGWQVNKNDHIFLALRPQIPRVHKISWNDEKSSRDWLKRISEMNSALLPLNAESANYLGELVNKQGSSGTQKSFKDSPNNLEERPLKRSDKTDESCLSRKPISHSLQIPDESKGRKPNPAYIGSISRIDVNLLCFSEISKKSYSDETLTASLFQPKNGKFATEYLQVNDLSSQGVFFPSEVSLQAKRKLSFEYIQEVSMLQYGHNSVENGNFRR